MLHVTDLLSRQAQLRPEQRALVGPDQLFTYGELERSANQIARWLREVQVRRGDRVLFMGVNRPVWVAGIFGTLKAGAAFVPVSPTIMPETLAYLIRDCQPRAVISDNEQITRHEQLLKMMDVPVLMLDQAEPRPAMSGLTTFTELNSFPDESCAVRQTPDDLAAIIYTSGTTKHPKGVVEPHRQIVFATQAINAVVQNTASDVVLCGLPFSFDYGLYQIFLCADVGATLIVAPNFDSALSIPHLLHTHSVTGFPGVPSLFALLLRSRLLERAHFPALRYLTSTGDVFPPAHIDRLRELLPGVAIFPMYGLTECKRVSILPPDALDTHRGSVGRPLPGTRVSILDDTGQEHSHGVGELIIRGPHIMAGYWNDPDETARRYLTDRSTGEPVLCSSDQFRIDQDGYLYFLGRDHMIIKRYGRRVSVAAIESFLCSLEGVMEAAAIGVPDPLQGETIYAFVSTSAPIPLEPEWLMAQCTQGLAHESRPEHISVTTSPLPKTANGKLDRVALQRGISV